MALTRTQAINRYKSYTVNQSSTNGTRGSDLINDYIAQIRGAYQWYFAKETRLLAVTASDPAVKMPANCAQVQTLSWLNGDTLYPMVVVADRKEFDAYRVITFESDIPRFALVENAVITLYPAPASSGSYLQCSYKTKNVKLTADDYTTGTVAFTNGSTTVTGTGTTFTTAMEGRSIQGGDGIFYEIETRTSNTVLVLNTPYLGDTQTGTGVTTLVGQMIPMPEGFELLPILKAAADELLTDQDKAGIRDRLIQQIAPLDTSMKKQYGTPTQDIANGLGRRYNIDYIWASS